MNDELLKAVGLYATPKQTQNSDRVIHAVHTLKPLSGMVSVINTSFLLYSDSYNNHACMCVLSQSNYIQPEN